MVGGRLQRFASEWLQISNSNFVYTTVAQGYRIPFVRTPPPHYDNTSRHHPLLFGSSSSFASGDTRTTTEKCGRRGFSHSSESSARFLQLDVRNSQEERRNETGLQLTQAQQLYGPAPFQNGNNQGSISSYYTQRLFGIDRLNTRFSSYSYPSRVTEVPQVLLEIQDLSMVYHSLRSLLYSVCLYQGLSPYPRLGSITENQAFGTAYLDDW